MPYLRPLRRYTTLALSAVFLSGCAAPPALQILSFAIDGISYLATDKTIADHGLSAVAQKDCKMLRTFKGENICQTEEEVTIEKRTIEKAMIDPEKPIAQMAQ